MHSHLFDPAADTFVTYGRLPHWEQAGRFSFITFRTADSLPRAVVEATLDERDRWLWSHGIDATRVDWPACVRGLTPAQRREFAARFTESWHHQLDSCHGSCLLRIPRLRSIVATVLLSHDGVSYDVDSFVVMPNHVHLLVGLGDIGDLRSRCRSWKHLSARRINAALGRRGTFWQNESWDRLVRSEEAFERIRRYIAANPARSRLRGDEFTLYERAAPPEPGCFATGTTVARRHG
jgi:putative transposase